jgi:hypothetical protein
VRDDVPFAADARSLGQLSTLTLDTAHGPLDLLRAPDGAPPYEELRRRATRIELDGFAVLVASLEDLGAMKRATGRAKDQLDLEEIEAIRRLQRR